MYIPSNQSQHFNLFKVGSPISIKPFSKFFISPKFITFLPKTLSTFKLQINLIYLYSNAFDSSSKPKTISLPSSNNFKSSGDVCNVSIFWHNSCLFIQSASIFSIFCNSILNCYWICFVNIFFLAFNIMISSSKLLSTSPTIFY